MFPILTKPSQNDDPDEIGESTSQTELDSGQPKETYDGPIDLPEDVQNGI